MPRFARPFKYRAAQIRALRERHELTQTELGELCGVTRRTVARWERDGAIVDRSIAYIRNSPYAVLERLAKVDSARNGSLKSRLRRDRSQPLTVASPKMSHR